MGGFFGVVSKRDAIPDVFFGTDYHSHLGTKRAGMASYDSQIGLQRDIHNIENSPFRTKFEKVFEDYNKEYPDTFDLSRPAVVGETFKPNGKLRGRCKVIVINYQGKTQKALIAHTFSSQALCRAFGLMQKYGQFCFSEFVK